VQVVDMPRGIPRKNTPLTTRGGFWKLGSKRTKGEPNVEFHLHGNNAESAIRLRGGGPRGTRTRERRATSLRKKCATEGPAGASRV